MAGLARPWLAPLSAGYTFGTLRLRVGQLAGAQLCRQAGQRRWRRCRSGIPSLLLLACAEHAGVVSEQPSKGICHGSTTCKALSGPRAPNRRQRGLGNQSRPHSHITCLPIPAGNLLAVWLWASYLTFLNFHFLIRMWGQWQHLPHGVALRVK